MQIMLNKKFRCGLTDAYEIQDKTGRSYYFEGMEKVSDKKFIMLWGS